MHPTSQPKRRDLIHLLHAAGIADATQAPRLPASVSRDERAASEPLLIVAMARLCEESAREFFARCEEIAYLANVLAAGCTIQRRRLRPVEAVRAAIAACNLGLELVDDGRRGNDALEAAVATLSAYPADGLFRIAWSRLHADEGLVSRDTDLAFLRELLQPGEPSED